jgi:hypothetical protein
MLEEVLKIVLDVQGREQLDDLRKAERRLSDELKAAVSAFGAADAAAAANDATVRRLATDLNNIRANLNETAAAVKGLGAGHRDLAGLAQGASTKINELGGKLRDAKQWTHQLDTSMKDASGGGAAALLGQLAYLADDLQYVGTQGIRPLMNNLAPMLNMMGPWGSAMAVVGVGAYQVAQNWRLLTHNLRSDLFEQGADATQVMTDRLKELKAEAYLTAREMGEMRHIEAALAGEKAEAESAAAPSKRQAAIKSAYQEAITEDKGGFGVIQSAAQEAVMGGSKLTPGANLRAIKEALASGEMKLTFDFGREAGPAGRDNERLYRGGEEGFGKVGAEFVRRLDSEYVNQVIINRRKALIDQLSKGDVQALRELERSLKATGYEVDDQGNVTAPNGKRSQALSTLLRAEPERAKARELDDRVFAEQRETFRDEGRKATAEINRQIGDVLEDAFRDEMKKGAGPERARESIKPIIRDYIERNFPLLASDSSEFGHTVGDIAADVAERSEGKIGREATSKAQAAFGQAARERFEKAIGENKSTDAAMRELNAWLDEKIKNTFPQLARFPDQARKLRNELSERVKNTVMGGLNALIESGMTLEQAQRHLKNQAAFREADRAEALDEDDPARVRQRLAERGEARQGRLAADQFTELARAQAREAMRLNPLMRPPSARELREQGAAMQSQAAAMGLDEQQQARLARLMQDPNNRRVAGAILNRMGGADPRQSLLMAMEAMETGDIRGTVNRGRRRSRAAENAAIRAQMREENEQMRALMGLGRRVPGRRRRDGPDFKSVGLGHDAMRGPGPASPAEQAAPMTDDSKKVADNSDEQLRVLKSIDERLANGVPTVLS